MFITIAIALTLSMFFIAICSECMSDNSSCMPIPFNPANDLINDSLKDNNVSADEIDQMLKDTRERLEWQSNRGMSRTERQEYSNAKRLQAIKDECQTIEDNEQELEIIA